MILYDPTDPQRQVERFTFPCQSSKKRLCISNLFRNVDFGEHDVIGFTCVTVGSEASQRAKVRFEANQYSECPYLYGMSVECARRRQSCGIKVCGGGAEDRKCRCPYSSRFINTKLSWLLLQLRICGMSEYG